MCVLSLITYNYYLPLTLNAVAFQSGVLTAGWAVASLILFVRFRFAIVTSHDSNDYS